MMMKRLIAVAIVCLPMVADGRPRQPFNPLLNNGTHVAGGGTRVLFNAPLISNGTVAADPSMSWPSTLTGLGSPAPSGCWWADDSTGSGTATTGTFTASGSTTAVNTPFCPDGSWSDLTSGCMVARRFAGSEYYTNDTSTIGDLSADFSLWAIGRHSATLSAFASKSESDDEGWEIYADGSGNIDVYIEDNVDGNATATSAIGTASSSVWLDVGFSLDLDGNTTAYAKGVAGTSVATPSGGFSVSNPMAIGANRAGGNYKANGDLALVCWWSGTVLSATDYANIHKYFTGILDTKGAPVAYTDTGPNCCVVDGKWECFGDDFPMLGCEIPPGMTGAGAPASGRLDIESLTDSLVYSRQLGTGGWSSVGGTALDCATGTWPELFRDNRRVCQLKDTTAASVIHIHQTIDITALNTNDPVVVCVYAGADDGSQYVDVGVDELTGCAGSTHDFAGQAVTATGSMHQFAFTVTDGTCTELELHVAPVQDHDDGPAMGAIYPVVQLFKGRSMCPPIYIETAAAAVGAGDTYLSYTITGTGIVDASGNLQPGITVSVDIADNGGWNSGSLGPITLLDTATAADYVRMSYGAGDYKEQCRSTGNANENIYDRTGAAHTMTAGTFYTLTWTPGPTVAPTLAIDGVAQPGTASAYSATQPDSIDTLEVGGSGGASQETMWYRNGRITR